MAAFFVEKLSRGRDCAMEVAWRLRICRWAPLFYPGAPKRLRNACGSVFRACPRPRGATTKPRYHETLGDFAMTLKFSNYSDAAQPGLVSKHLSTCWWSGLWCCHREGWGFKASHIVMRSWFTVELLTCEFPKIRGPNIAPKELGSYCKEQQKWAPLFWKPPHVGSAEAPHAKVLRLLGMTSDIRGLAYAVNVQVLCRNRHFTSGVPKS